MERDDGSVACDQCGGATYEVGTYAMPSGSTWDFRRCLDCGHTCALTAEPSHKTATGKTADS